MLQQCCWSKGAVIADEDVLLCDLGDRGIGDRRHMPAVPQWGGWMDWPNNRMGKTIIKRSRDTSTQLTRDLTCRRFETRHRNPSVTQLVGSIGAAWPDSSSGDLTWAGRFADLELEEQKRDWEPPLLTRSTRGWTAGWTTPWCTCDPPPPVGNGGDTPSVIAPNPRGGGRGRTSDCRFAGFWSAREVCAQRRCSGPPRISQMRPMFHPSASWQRKAPPKRS